MQPVASAKPRLGWKIYFTLLALLTAAGMPTLRREALELINLIVSTIGLVGLFGYAWSAKVPGHPQFWRAIGAISATLVIANIGVMLARTIERGITEDPIILALASLVAAGLTLPTSVALFRYAGQISSIGGPRTKSG